MKSGFRDVEHLARLALLFAVGVVLLLVFRAVVVPAGFGEYGHFRPGAMDDAANHEMHFAGRAACAECHDDVVKTKSGGAHARIGCESCHGPLAPHVADPDAVKPTLPVVAELCVRCHAANISRPAGFPQVEPDAHSEGSPCNDCHDPHAPDA